jgi:ABC-type siderophore export system fused ATPase/permease subunit
MPQVAIKLASFANAAVIGSLVYLSMYSLTIFLYGMVLIIDIINIMNIPSAEIAINHIPKLG